MVQLRAGFGAVWRAAAGVQTFFFLVCSVYLSMSSLYRGCVYGIERRGKEAGNRGRGTGPLLVKSLTYEKNGVAFRNPENEFLCQTFEKLRVKIILCGFIGVFACFVCA
jgi:hypothetical protein